ncbi:Nn.00g013380.m01.CDS01 [Neocucurbitaria sp. VM-36]
MSTDLTADVVRAYAPTSRHRKPKAKSSSREKQFLSTILQDHQALYNQSQLSQNISRQLQATFKNSATPVTTILSLGLGSLRGSKGQTRRLKQLTILLAIQDTFRRISGRQIDIYAQDPTFTRADESFLTSLGIRILRTPSGSVLGEAATIIRPSTLIYSPFLTLEAYEQLLLNIASSIQFLVGDDFNALLNKWPKYSAERTQVEGIIKVGLSRYRRRVVDGEGFWTEEDGTFPMAVYGRLDGAERRRGKAML